MCLVCIMYIYMQLPLSAKMICTELTLHSDRLGGAKPPPTPGKKSRYDDNLKCSVGY